jgi:hypothetical protein
MVIYPEPGQFLPIQPTEYRLARCARGLGSSQPNRQASVY